ncbi:hypothetical protein ES705_09991 [subsurface metagenome]
MTEGEKIRSIEFSSAGCSINGEKPIPVKMPAEVAPPGSLDTVKAKKPAGLEEPKMHLRAGKARALYLARVHNYRKSKEPKKITEV